MLPVQRSGLIAVALCALSARALAQAGQTGQTAAPPRKFYAGVAFEVSSQNGGSRVTSDPDQPNSSVGGAALGMTTTLGYHLSQYSSLAVEVSLPTRFQAIQEIHYVLNIRTDNRHREPTVSLLMHVHAPVSRGIHPEFVFGVSYVDEDTTQRAATASFGSNAFGPYGASSQLQRDTVGVTGGVDLGIQLTSRVQLVPQVRLHAITRDDPATGSRSSFLYLSPLVFRAALGLRTSF